MFITIYLAIEINKWIKINDNVGGGASRPRYIGSMSTYIKEVYKSANKKKYITKGGEREVEAGPNILILWPHR